MAKAKKVHPGSGLQEGTTVRWVVEGVLGWHSTCKCRPDHGSWMIDSETYLDYETKLEVVNDGS